MLCVGQQLAYCVYLVALFHVLFSAVNVYVFYEQITVVSCIGSCGEVTAEIRSGVVWSEGFLRHCR